MDNSGVTEVASPRSMNRTV